jgi:AraC-like DNA-binding protein
VFFGNLIEVMFEKTGNQMRLTHIPLNGIRADLLQFLIEEKICYDMALQRLIGLDKFPLEHLALTYSEPAHREFYGRLITCPIVFSAARNTMLLWDNALALPLHGRDPETHGHCIKLLKDVFASVNAGSSLSHKVKAMLYENLDRNLHINDVAKALNCTSRTLNRTLAKGEENFRNLHVAARLETIKNLLATTDLESKEIAAHIGFSDVRSLRRFFKTQTGRTIKQFRTETVSGKLKHDRF